MRFLTLFCLASLLCFSATPARAQHGFSAPAKTETEAKKPEAEHEENIGQTLVHILSHHLIDSQELEIFGLKIHLPTITSVSLGIWLNNNLPWLGVQIVEIRITKHRVWWVVSGLLVLLLTWLAGRKQSAVPTGLRNVFEVLIVFIRDEILRPNIGHKADRFLPYFLSLFTAILFSNLLGLFPWGASATGNVNVTAGLALCTLGMMVGLGVKENGLFGFMHSFAPPGVPLWLMPLIVIIEIVSFMIRPFALTIRLFANMLAGHAVIAVLLGLIVSFWFAIPSVAVATGVMLLEIVVALIQAYIFTMLTAVFVGLTMHPAH